MDCENRGKRHGVYKAGRVTHAIFNCSDPNVGFCTLNETGLKSNGKPLAVCSLECPFYKEHGKAEIIPPTITVAPRQSDRAVVTLAIGKNFNELLTISRPTFEAYAKKCGADFIPIQFESSDYPEGDKFVIPQLFDAGYKEILFIDADAIVMPDAENLFDVVPPEFDIALHDDVPMLRGRGWLDAEYRNLIASQGWDMESIQPCRNTGVILIRESGRLAFEVPAKPFPRTHTAEQSLINLNIIRHNLSVYNLDRAWNNQWWFEGKLPERTGTRIYHWASAPHETRLREMTARRDGRMTGLGDLVAKGIQVATFGMVKPCGACKERQAKLNQLVPFRS